MAADLRESDLLHTNSVKVLSQALAAKFPLFKAGQVLLSLRNLDTLAVAGPAHAPRGLGGPRDLAASNTTRNFWIMAIFFCTIISARMQETRILEYDPLTQAIPWAYANENSTPFSAIFRGMKQRLPNGNTLIVDPDNRRLFEVTPRQGTRLGEFLSVTSSSARPDPRGHRGQRRAALWCE